MREIHVVAGVFCDSAGRALVSQRAADKAHGGEWEFPGGKIEAGEQPLQALVRELQEELAVQVLRARHLLRYSHSNGTMRVHLYVWRILDWDGEIMGAEGQALRWLPVSDLLDEGLLLADGPIVAKLKSQRISTMSV